MNEENIAEKLLVELRKLVPAESLEKVVAIISDKLKSEKSRVVVTLANRPSEELRLKVEREAGKLFGLKTIFEYRVSPEIVGGFILEGQGRYYDYSLGNRINKLLKNE